MIKYPRQKKYSKTVRRITVTIPANDLYLYSAAVKLAYDQEITVSEVFRRALAEYLVTRA